MLRSGLSVSDFQSIIRSACMRDKAPSGSMYRFIEFLGQQVGDDPVRGCGTWLVS